MTMKTKSEYTAYVQAAKNRREIWQNQKIKIIVRRKVQNVSKVRIMGLTVMYDETEIRQITKQRRDEPIWQKI